MLEEMRACILHGDYHSFEDACESAQREWLRTYRAQRLPRSQQIQWYHHSVELVMLSNLLKEIKSGKHG